MSHFISTVLDVVLILCSVALPPSDLPSNITDYDELYIQSHNPPIKHKCAIVNIQESSTQALVQVVEKNGKYTLSLDGNDNTNTDSMNCKVLVLHACMYYCINECD